MWHRFRVSHHRIALAYFSGGAALIEARLSHLSHQFVNLDSHHVVILQTTMDDDDHSTANMDFTPGTTIVYDDRDQRPSDISPRPSLVFPRPGNTYIIRDGEEGHVLSLFDGHVCLVPSDTLGASIYWKCHETRGWLGFKNLASG